MALTWDIIDCKFSDEERKENWNVIESTIWTMMVIDLNGITEKNLETAQFRIRCYMKVSGQNYNDVLAFLPRMVGLKVNVSNKTEKEYDKKLLSVLHYDVRAEMKRFVVGN